MTKKHLSLISVLLILSLFVGCGAKSAEIKNDVAVTDISAKVTSVLSDDALVSVDADYIKGSMKMDVSDYDSYDVKINSKGVNIDEIGIFKAKDASQLVTVTKAVNDYIQMRKDTWMVEYMPEERPKLDSSEVMILGNYVMYAILSDEDKHAAFKAFEKALKA
ncbi:MAG: DUF4358 domain-containing protein [Oscillospiraceae bacterium]